MIPDWSDRRAFVVGCGPSLTQEDCDRLKGEKVIAVNCALRYVPFAEILYGCDHKWWHVYENPIPEKDWPGWGWFKGLKCSIDRTVKSEYQDVITFGYQQKEVLSKDPERLANGGNGGYQAANLAFHTGANPIYLLGFDMKGSPEKNHCHPDHDDKKRFHLPGSKHLHRLNNPSQVLYKQWIEHFYNLYRAMKPEGVDLINLSRDTALTVPRDSLENVLHL